MDYINVPEEGTVLHLTPPVPQPSQHYSTTSRVLYTPEQPSPAKLDLVAHKFGLPQGVLLEIKLFCCERVMVRDVFGRTLLHHASSIVFCRSESIRVLLKCALSAAGLQDDYGRTALQKLVKESIFGAMTLTQSSQPSNC